MSSKEKYSFEPRITVITSLYKAGDHIDLFLEEIQKQTIFSDIDWYFIDANSPDGELEKILEYQKEFKNVRIASTRERIGIYEAWNKGIKKAKAEFISNLNVDDKISHEYYEIMLNELKKRKDVDIIYSDIYVTEEKEKTFKDFNEEDDILITPKFCDIHSVMFFGAAHNCPVWRKSIHDDLGLFDEGFTSSGDKEFWMRANVSGKKFKKINIPLAVYYYNPEGISTKGAKNGMRPEIVEKEDEIIRKHYSQEINDHGLRNYNNNINS